MTNRAAFLLLMLVLCHGIAMAMGFYTEREEDPEDWRTRRWRERETEEEEEGGSGGGGRGEDSFLLRDSKHVIQTDAGEMRVVKGFRGRIVERPMHIGFITMEPKSLFIPQYIDSSLILFIRRGEAKVGLIYKDELTERQLRIGDIYQIPAGSAFYLVNTGEGQRLHVICSIDPSESLGLGAFQSFFIGGGSNPTSILRGFDPDTLSTAFNVTTAELKEVMTGQQEGPIVYIGDSRAPRPSVWARFLQLKESDRLNHLKRMVEIRQEPIGDEEEEEEASWSWRKLLGSVFGEGNKKTGWRTGSSPDSYNIYDRKPDFRNNYGWSVLLDKDDYRPLKHSGIGIYLVNLTAGSMMAPHVNPTATEYGVVLRGSGRIQIVHPNGTQAMNTEVKEGDVFWVPRYFAFCQIASRSSPFEFFGFTTSARKNRPQFLVGASSILQTLRGPELAASFGVSEDRVARFIDAQRESVILPTASIAPPDKMQKEVNFVRMKRVIKNLGNHMVMGFD